MLISNRHITHLDMDNFFVSVEQLHNPKLKGKPVLIGGSSDRGVVTSCSPEAKRFGIHAAMPMRSALNLCRNAIVVKSDYEAYSKYSTLVTDIVRDTVPLFEKASIDEFYIDLTGMDKFFGCRQFSDDLKSKINKESGLPLTYGLASNKLISKIAANEVKQYGQNGQIEIPFGEEKNFLAPLSIMKIPGVGIKTGYQLMKMGIETVKLLRKIPVEMLQNLLGKNGTELWRRAQGIDDSPIVPYREAKSISTEQTFQQDSIDMNFLHSELVRMTEKIAFQLRSENRLTGCVTVKLRYTDFETHTQQASIEYTNADHILLKVSRELFDKLYNRRILVRLIGIKFSDLVSGTYQISLFDDRQEMIKLYQAIDSVKKQFGERFVQKASGMYQR